MGDYCTVDQVRQFLKDVDIDVVTSDPELQRLLEKAKDGINRSTRMAFEPTALVERYDGKGQQKLILNHWPLISLTYAKIYNMNNQLVRTLAESDVILEKPIGCITIPAPFYWLYYWPYTPYFGSVAPSLTPSRYDYFNLFGIGTANVEVSYNYGYATAPPRIADAAIKMVSIEILQKKGVSQTQGTSGVSMVGITETYGQTGAAGGSGPFKGLIDEWQKDIEEDLALYRSKPVRVI